MLITFFSINWWYLFCLTLFCSQFDLTVFARRKAYVLGGYILFVSFVHLFLRRCFLMSILHQIPSCFQDSTVAIIFHDWILFSCVLFPLHCEFYLLLSFCSCSFWSYIFIPCSDASLCNGRTSICLSSCRIYASVFSSFSLVMFNVAYWFNLNKRLFVLFKFTTCVIYLLHRFFCLKLLL